MDKLKKILREKNKCINSIFISSYIPRKCGIATYTKDLTRAINLINPYSKSEIVALVKPEDKIDYPPEVKLKINQYKVDSYVKAADHINKSKTDIVVLEHEFGLYGGDFGEYIIKLIELIKKPLIVTT
ncbi:glycosyl transferase, partial [bacterium]|nr:glycosyl transferase [bacterium]